MSPDLVVVLVLAASSCLGSFLYVWLGFDSTLAEDIGREGERAARGWLQQIFPSASRFHDVYLDAGRGVVQIDHIVIDPGGVFVVETKKWRGWIFGSAHDHQWTVIDRQGRRKRRRNPIRQNAGHVAAVRRTLGLGDEVVSVVLMVGDAEFRTPVPAGVMYPGDLAALVGRGRGLLLTPDRAAKLTQRLELAWLPSTHRVRARHRTRVTLAERASGDPAMHGYVHRR